MPECGQLFWRKYRASFANYFAGKQAESTKADINVDI